MANNSKGISVYASFMINRSMQYFMEEISGNPTNLESLDVKTDDSINNNMLPRVSMGFMINTGSLPNVPIEPSAIQTSRLGTAIDIYRKAVEAFNPKL